MGGGDHPWKREVDAGEPDVAELGDRPAVVNRDDVEGSYEGKWRRLARAAGGELRGLNWAHLDLGDEGAAPHVHSADEEIFVILEGEGVLELWPTPQHAREGLAYEEIRSGRATSSRARPVRASRTAFARACPG